MEANELRMGNYFLETGSKIIYKLDCFYGFGTVKPYQEYDDDMYFDIDDISPIPLTEEILLKCGFEKIGNTYFFNVVKDKSIQIYFFPLVNGVDLSIQGGTVALYKMQYLHQLQNLYFALTSTELEINL